MRPSDGSASFCFVDRRGEEGRGIGSTSPCIEVRYRYGVNNPSVGGGAMGGAIGDGGGMGGAKNFHVADGLLGGVAPEECVFSLLPASCSISFVDP